jgi:NADH-quinone oxidoreductase subunit C
MAAPVMNTGPSVIDTLQARFSKVVIATSRFRGQETMLIRREGLLELARALKHELQYDFLMDLSCVDYLKFGRSKGSAPTLATPSPLPYYMQPKPSGEPWARGASMDDYRFDVVYHFYSSVRNVRLRVRVPVSVADPSVDSLTGLWAGANWFEREAWDLFGVHFTGHPDLKRILMYEEFEGHPLRKDYPVNRRQPLIGPVN